MKLSTKGRYAVTAMLDLALNANNTSRVTLADISEFQGISLSYLEQLFARLRKAKLVQGTRGPGGGYRLGRPAGDISIAEIIDAIDDRPNRSKHITLAPNSKHIATEELWDDLSHEIFDFLDHITLGTLVDKKKHNGSGASGIGVIPPDEESWQNLGIPPSSKPLS